MISTGPDLTKQQQNLYNQLEEAITNRQDVTDLLKGASKDDLLKVLTTTNIIRVNLDSQYGTKYAFTLLGYAIHCNNQKSVQAILTAAKEQDILEAVLATANIGEYFPGQNVQDILKAAFITTPLGFAICRNNQKSIQAILTAAKEQGILEIVLTTANISRDLSNARNTCTGTFAPLSYAIGCNNQENVQAILTAAKEQGILEIVLATEVIQDETILEIAKEYGVLEEVLAIKKEKGQVPSSKLGVQDLSKVVNDVRQAH